MLQYLLRRILLIPVTLFAIMLVNFGLSQFVPGGPVEQMLAKIQGSGGHHAESMGAGSGTSSASGISAASQVYRGNQGLDQEYLEQLKKSFGLDKPFYLRFFEMMKNYLAFDFGESYFRNKKVLELVKERLPVSLTLGVWSSLIIYLIGIPLGIRAAVRNGSTFEATTSIVVTVLYSIPSFLFAILLIALFSGGNYLNIFPLRGLVSSGWESFTFTEKILDYLWHMTLPVLAITLGGFASLYSLTKNSFLDELGKQYVTAVRARGATNSRVIYGHIFQNAMIVVISHFPALLLSCLFTGSILIETIFSLNGIGLLGFESIMSRDYPVVFATVYIFTLFGLVVNLLRDIIYHYIDPRMNLEAKESI